MQRWQILDTGPTNGPVTVLLHGWLGHAREWLSLRRDEHAPQRWLMPALPGHHKPTAALWTDPDEQWSCDTIVEALVEQIVETHQCERWHLIGYSMGGRLALLMAHRYPKRVLSLLLENAQPGITGSTPEIAERARQNRALLDDQRAAQILSNGLPSFVESWYKAPLFSSLHARPEVLSSITEQRLTHDAFGVAAALSRLSPGRQPDLWPKLSGLALPVTLLTGDLDDKYKQIMQEMAQALPVSTLAIAPDAGHNVHAETPEFWQKTLREHQRYGD